MPLIQAPRHQTKVARRMTVAFVVCAAVPLAALAGITISRTWKELSKTAAERLRYDSRTVTQDALGRLDRLALSLADIAVTDAGRLPDHMLADHLPVRPAAVTLRLAAGPSQHLVGSLEMPTLSPGDEQHLADWGRLIVQVGTTPVLIVREPGEQVLMAATLDARWLFGLDEPDQLPPDASVCVMTPSGTPQCSVETDAEAARRLMVSVEQGEGRLEADGEPQLAWFGAMSLDAQYNAPAWRVALMRPLSLVRAPVIRFVKDLLLIVFAASLLVAWITLRQVRRHLQPLGALTAATRRLSRHEFDNLVEVKSGDEFEVLGQAFNDMAVKLRHQFAELEDFNIGTLTTLARAIDAKSPWTAGHSERVTAMAITIGKAIGVGDDELACLYRGGLVHDIGKLATPVEILDKPARLTPDEERIMQLHPEQGVHILEPITAFRPVLPIVGQHHERWDGRGYPRGLAGPAIAHTARILAVADVYDALRSDRPYRAGLPHDRVLGIIREGSGTHFDPDVVVAFLKVADRIDEAAKARVA